MKLFKKPLAVLSAMAVAASMMSALTASAEDEGEEKTTYTVTFDGNGNSAYTTQTFEIPMGTSIGKYLDGKLDSKGWNLINQRIYGGQMLCSWSDESEVDDDDFDFEDLYDIVDQDITLFAQWNNVITETSVTLDTSKLKVGESVTLNQSIVTLPEGANYKLYEVYVASAKGEFADNTAYLVEIELSAKEGYSFSCSSEGNSYKELYRNKMKSTELNGQQCPVDVYSDTLYYEYMLVFGEPETVKLTLDFGDAKPQYTQDVYKGIGLYQSVNYDNTLMTPSEDGYVFSGWFKDKDYKESIAYPFENRPTEDTTYYALMQKIVDKLEFVSEAPKCGTETTTDLMKNEEGTVIEGKYDPRTQTNTPVIKAAEGTPIEFAFVCWIEGEPRSFSELMLDQDAKPFIGKFEGGKKYTVAFMAVSEGLADIAKALLDTENMTEEKMNELLQSFKVSKYYIDPDAECCLDGEKIECYITTSSRNNEVRAVHPVNSAGSTMLYGIGSIEAVHDWDDGVIDPKPTCEEKGKKTISCKGCDEKKTEDIDALGHDWGEWKLTKAPTTEAEGEETRICKRDESHKETRSVAKIAKEDDNSPPTGAAAASATAVLVLLAAAFTVRKHR